MNTVSMPGFTAERSMQPAQGQFRAVAFDTYGRGEEVIPQKMICTNQDGVLMCVNPTCRQHCYISKKGAALRACLDDC